MLIDVWALKTFDQALLATLQPSADLVRSYLYLDHQNFLHHDRGGSRSLTRPENPCAGDYLQLVEAVGREMESRSIRAWHYTRLTDGEVADLRDHGVQLSTLSSLRARLDAQVTAGTLTADAASALFTASPLNNGQADIRENRFWMVSHPVDVEDGGVRPLLEHWGGEAASMWVKDAALLEPLTEIGTPRVLEVEVPLRLTKHSYLAGRAVVATFARSLGCIPDKGAFDLYVVEPLPAGAVQAVHSRGDTTFVEIGRQYPSGYLDTDCGRWKELTGEDG